MGGRKEEKESIEAVGDGKGRRLSVKQKSQKRKENRLELLTLPFFPF